MIPDLKSQLIVNRLKHFRFVKVKPEWLKRRKESRCFIPLSDRLWAQRWFATLVMPRRDI